MGKGGGERGLEVGGGNPCLLAAVTLRCDVIAVQCMAKGQFLHLLISHGNSATQFSHLLTLTSNTNCLPINLSHLLVLNFILWP